MLTRKELKEEIEIAVAHISQALNKALETLATKEELKEEIGRVEGKLEKVEGRLENIEVDIRDIKRDVSDLKRITNLEKAVFSS